MQDLNYAKIEHELKNTQEVKNKIDEEKKKIIPDEVLNRMFEEKLVSVSQEELEKMTLDELKEFNIALNGDKFIEEPNMEDDDLADFLRGWMLYFKNSADFNVELDNLVKELEEITKQNNKKLEELMKERGDDNVIDFLRHVIDDNLTKARGIDNQQLINRSLKMSEVFEDTFNLEILKELYRQIGGKNTKEEAKCKANYIYEKYRKKALELGLKNDLVYASDLEKKFLPEKYHESNNLFVFIVMKYISKLSVTKGVDRIKDKFFVAQLTTNIFLLYQEKGLPDKYKERLLTSIQELLDIVI